MHTITLNFLNKVEVTLKAEKPQLVDFIRNNLSYFEREGDAERCVMINIHNDVSKIKEGEDLVEKIGKNAYISGDTLHYYNNIGNYFVKIKGKNLEINASLRENIIKRYLISIFHKRSFVPLKNVKNSVYLDFMRSIIHFPVFWMLEREGYFLIHASAVEKNGYGLILFGLNDVGKTTIMQSLLKKGFKYITDNYLLFDDKFIYAFPEPIGLSKYDYNAFGRVVYQTNDKFFVKIKNKNISPCAKPLLAFLVSRSKNAEYFNPLSSISVFNLLFVINDFLKEFHNYSYINLLNYLLCDDDRTDLERLRVETYLKFSKSVKSFRIINKDLDRTVEKIEEVFDNEVQYQ